MIYCILMDYEKVQFRSDTGDRQRQINGTYCADDAGQMISSMSASICESEAR